jgi:hypothetical protein
MVDRIGVDKLTEYGIITEDLKANDGIDNVEMSEGDAGSAADVMSECADIKELFTSAMGELPEEAQQCVDENLSDEVLHDFLVAIFMNDEQGGQDDLINALRLSLRLLPRSPGRSAMWAAGGPAACAVAMLTTS